jgi:CBS domain-containing protein
VGRDTNLRDVLAIMVTRGVESVVVADGGQDAGGLTFRDIITQVRDAR